MTGELGIQLPRDVEQQKTIHDKVKDLIKHNLSSEDALRIYDVYVHGPRNIAIATPITPLREHLNTYRNLLEQLGSASEAAVVENDSESTENVPEQRNRKDRANNAANLRGLASSEVDYIFNVIRLVAGMHEVEYIDTNVTPPTQKNLINKENVTDFANVKAVMLSLDENIKSRDVKFTVEDLDLMIHFVEKLMDQVTTSLNNDGSNDIFTKNPNGENIDFNQNNELSKLLLELIDTPQMDQRLRLGSILHSVLNKAELKPEVRVALMRKYNVLHFNNKQNFTGKNELFAARDRLSRFAQTYFNRIFEIIEGKHDSELFFGTSDENRKKIIDTLVNYSLRITSSLSTPDVPEGLYNMLKLELDAIQQGMYERIKLSKPSYEELSLMQQNWKKVVAEDVQVSTELGEYKDKLLVIPFTSVYYSLYERLIYKRPLKNTPSSPENRPEMKLNNAAIEFFKNNLKSRYKEISNGISSSGNQTEADVYTQMKTGLERIIGYVETRLNGFFSQNGRTTNAEFKKYENYRDELIFLNKNEQNKYKGTIALLEAMVGGNAMVVRGDEGNKTKLKPITDNIEILQHLEDDESILSEMLLELENTYGPIAGQIMQMVSMNFKRLLVNNEMNSLGEGVFAWNDEHGRYHFSRAKKFAHKIIYGLVVSSGASGIQGYQQYKEIIDKLTKSQIPSAKKQGVNDLDLILALGLRMAVIDFHLFEIGSMAKPTYKSKDLDRNVPLVELGSADKAKFNRNELLTSYKPGGFAKKTQQMDPRGQINLEKDTKVAMQQAFRDGTIEDPEGLNLNNVASNLVLDTFEIRPTNLRIWEAWLTEQLTGIEGNYNPDKFGVTGKRIVNGVEVPYGVDEFLGEAGVSGGFLEIRKLTDNTIKANNLTQDARYGGEKKTDEKLEKRRGIQYRIKHGANGEYNDTSYQRAYKELQQEVQKQERANLWKKLLQTDPGEFLRNIRARIPEIGLYDITFESEGKIIHTSKDAHQLFFARTGLSDTERKFSDQKRKEWTYLFGSQKGLDGLGHIALFFHNYFQAFNSHAKDVDYDDEDKLEYMYELLDTTLSRASLTRNLSRQKGDKLKLLSKEHFQKLDNNDEQPWVEEYRDITGLSKKKMDLSNKLLDNVSSLLLNDNGLIRILEKEDTTTAKKQDERIINGITNTSKDKHDKMRLGISMVTQVDVELADKGFFSGVDNAWNTIFKHRLPTRNDLNMISMHAKRAKDTNGEEMLKGSMKALAENNGNAFEQYTSGLIADGVDMIKDIVFKKHDLKKFMNMLKAASNYIKQKGESHSKDDQREFCYKIIFNACKSVMMDQIFLKSVGEQIAYDVTSNTSSFFRNINADFLNFWMVRQKDPQKAKKMFKKTMDAYDQVDENQTIHSRNITVGASKTYGAAIYTAIAIREILWLVASEQESILARSPNESRWNVLSLLEDLNIDPKEMSRANTKDTFTRFLVGLGGVANEFFLKPMYETIKDELGIQTKGGKKAV